ncbi:Integrase [Bryocella elongata]|uniref:Integrase n=1 Tax=Bryocella elongata TaxID=863522 RepID=A0A1H6B5A1_9BACT|nr:integrase arm-type DNA-binding domain-containing protein [Bryocella elongata]SEG55800.1 Integrase [Bryocella elongata]
MPLTDMELRGLKPGTKTRKVFDGQGLYLQIEPGGAKYWRLKYRFAGVEKRLALGVYPEIGLKRVRELRDDARRLLAEGRDPGVERRVQRAMAAAQLENNFEAIAREWFAMREKIWAHSHSDRVLRRLERDVYPVIGKRPIGELTAPEVLALLRRVERRTVETAHRIMRDVDQIFRYAISTGRCTRNIVPDLRGALQPYSNDHFAATLDPKRLGSILAAMDRYTGTQVVCSALRLAPLVFVRPGELRMALWKDIDLDAAEWRYHVPKTGTDHIVPLSRQVVAILRDLHDVTGQGQRVFPGARSPSRPMSNIAVLVAMRSLQIGKQEMTGHGFRAVARTLLDEVLGFRPDIIEHQLAHAVKDPNGRAYNRTSHLPERRRMMQAWADYLEGLKASEVAG